MHETLAALFVAVFAYVREKLRGQVDIEEITRVAKAVLDQMRAPVGPVNWEGALPMTVGRARWIEHVQRPIRVIGHVAVVEDPVVADIPRDGGVERVEMTTAKIVGVDGEQLRMLEVVGRPLIERFQAAHRRGRLHEFLGLVVVVPEVVNPKTEDAAPIGRFCFVPFDVRDPTSASDLLGASTDERAGAHALLAELRTSRMSPADYLFAELTANLGVVGLNEAPHLSDGIQAAILQSLSTGTIGNAPAKIHVMLVGPPGVGKKLVGLCARALNPVCHEASASKITAAGLIGASHLTETGWRSTPGLLPLAAEGVVVLQDAHGLKGSKLEQLAPILQELIEDGEVRDSVSGGRKRSARTSTLIDLNRTAQVRVGGASDASEAAILGALPLLSRVDVILEIPVDADRAWTVGEQLYRALPQGNSTTLDDQAWARRLRVLVALLRDEHPTVDTTAVLPLMEAAHRRLRDENADFSEGSPTEASAVPVRAAVSFTRLVVASARANDRSVATEADVDRALDFVRRKIDFVRRAVRLSGLVSECPSVRRAANQDFWQRRAGKTVTVTEVTKNYEDETGNSVSPKTITRELRRRGAKNVKHGAWKLPAPDGHSAASEPDGTNGHPDTRTCPPPPLATSTAVNAGNEHAEGKPGGARKTGRSRPKRVAA